MNMRGLKYIVRRGDGFQLRLPIPKDLQDKLQRKELRWSLRTDSRSVAAQKAFRATLVFVELCDSLRRMEHLSDAKIRDIIRAFYSTICAAYVPDASKGALARERNEHHSRLAAEEALDDLAGQLAAGTYSKTLEVQARRLATGFGLSFDELPELRRQQILEGIVRAYIEQGRFIEHRRLSLLDAYAPEDALFEGVSQESAASQDVLQSIAKAPPLIAAPKPDPIGPAAELSVGALVKKFLAAGRKVGVTANGPWKPKTAAEYDRVMGWLVESIGGDRHVASVGNDDVREFRDGVRQIRRKSSGAKTFTGLQTKITADQLAPKTARKYFYYGRLFFKWLQSEGYINTVPGASISIKVPDKPQSEKRRSLTTEEINLLVGSPLFAGFKSPHSRSVPGDNHLRDDFYWVPLLLLYSGMRLSEAVLVGHKFVDVKGPYPHLKLTTADQELKTLNAERIVPIHHELVDLGFLEFAKQRQTKPIGPRLFSRITSTAEIQNYYSKWLNGYFTKVGLDDVLLTAHSLRHHFIERAHSAQLSDSMVKRLVGHSQSSDVTAGYGSGPDLPALSEAMNKIDLKVSKAIFAKIGKGKNG